MNRYTTRPPLPRSVLVECVASQVLVDPAPPADVAGGVCPACGGFVQYGGTPDAPRYMTHNTTGGARP